MIVDKLVRLKQKIEQLKPTLIGREFEVANSLLVTAEGHSVSFLAIGMAEECKEKERKQTELNELIGESIELMNLFVTLIEEKSDEQI